MTTSETTSSAAAGTAPAVVPSPTSRESELPPPGQKMPRYIEVFSFAVPLPLSILAPAPLLDEMTITAARPTTQSASSAASSTTATLDRGIVGTITVVGAAGKQSILVWFGFGALEECSPTTAAAATTTTTATTEAGNNEDHASGVGAAGHLQMGPLVMAMPRVQYSSFSNGEAATSKLVGCPDEDVEWMASQMASRLSKRSQRPVLVSCSFANAPSGMMMMGGFAAAADFSGSVPAVSRNGGSGGGSVEAGLLQQRAAALAEREIWKVLQEKVLGESK